MIGIQETRGTDGCWVNKHWIRIAASGDKGNHGVELWVNRQLPYGTSEGVPLHFEKSHFAVVAKDPQRLLVRVEAPGVQLWAFVGHAPHGGLPEHQREQWWQDTVSLIRQHQAQNHCISFLDANATSGEAFAWHVIETQEEPNHSTASLHSFLSGTGSCLPASDSRLGPYETTWVSPNGQHAKRIDFVAVPFQELYKCTETFTGLGIDLNFHSADHSLTGVSMH